MQEVMQELPLTLDMTLRRPVALGHGFCVASAGLDGARRVREEQASRLRTAHAALGTPSRPRSEPTKLEHKGAKR